MHFVASKAASAPADDATTQDSALAVPRTRLTCSDFRCVCSWHRCCTSDTQSTPRASCRVGGLPSHQGAPSFDPRCCATLHLSQSRTAPGLASHLACRCRQWQRPEGLFYEFSLACAVRAMPCGRALLPLAAHASPPLINRQVSSQQVICTLAPPKERTEHVVRPGARSQPRRPRMPAYVTLSRSDQRLPLTGSVQAPSSCASSVALSLWTLLGLPKHVGCINMQSPGVCWGGGHSGSSQYHTCRSHNGLCTLRCATHLGW